MDWTQTFTLIGIIVALFVYMMNRMDSNQKQMSEKIDSVQKQTNTRIDTVQQQVADGFKQIEERFNILENRMTSLKSDAKHTNQRLSDFQMQVNQRFNTIENYVLPKKVIYEELKEN